MWSFVLERCLKCDLNMLQNCFICDRFVLETCLKLVVARVLGLATPESILLANFEGEREESNPKLRSRFFSRNRTIPWICSFQSGKKLSLIFIQDLGRLWASSTSPNIEKITKMLQNAPKQVQIAMWVVVCVFEPVMTPYRPEKLLKGRRVPLLMTCDLVPASLWQGISLRWHDDAGTESQVESQVMKQVDTAP
jgi:hypothetical protein